MAIGWKHMPVVSVAISGLLAGVSCRQILDIGERSTDCQPGCSANGMRLRCSDDGTPLEEACPQDKPICSVGECVACTDSTQCPHGDNPCFKPVCNAGTCDRVLDTAGKVPDPQPGDCQSPTCNPQGVPVMNPDPNDAVNDHLACTMDLCVQGKSEHVSKGNGTECATAGACLGAACLGTSIKLSVGHNNSCAVLQDGTVWCWGWNAYGQVGDGTLVDRAAPSRVANIGPGEFPISGSSTDGGTEAEAGADAGMIDPAMGIATALGTGYGHSCAILSGRFVACWGNNQAGQLGDGNAGNQSAVPVKVQGLPENATFVQVEAGYANSCVLTSDGEVYCWGLNIAGECGAKQKEPDGIDRTVVIKPWRVPLPFVRSFALKKEHACAVASGGEVWCWGENKYGQLGNGTTSLAPNPTPQKVPGIQAKEVATGWSHSCAVLVSMAEVMCWGKNSRGQLGYDPNPDTPDLEDSPTPQYVLTGAPDAGAVNYFESVQGIWAGSGSYTCAIKTQPTQMPWCWGGNDEGEMALGTSDTIMETYLYPQMTVLPSSTRAMAVGEDHGCAVVAEPDQAPNIWCYGGHDLGQVGNGQFAYKPDSGVGPDADKSWADGVLQLQPKPVKWPE